MTFCHARINIGHFTKREKSAIINCEGKSTTPMCPLIIILHMKSGAAKCSPFPI